MVPGVEIPVVFFYFTHFQQDGLPSLLQKSIVAIATSNNPLPFAIGYCCVDNFTEIMASGVYSYDSFNLNRKEK